jgi:predicted nucleotidyltransferase
MFRKEEIISKAWLVKEIIDLELHPLQVSRVFLVGSYAQNRATDRSDIDYLIELKGGKRVLTYPTWKQIQEINRKIDNKRIHCIYGTLEAQQSLYQKDPVRYTYREIKEITSVLHQ